MRFVFNERKAAQAAAHLLLLHDDRSMDLYVLIKLLYLADRKALLDTGYSITGDQMVSMQWGTLLSNVYDAIKQQSPDAGFAIWSEYMGRSLGFKVLLKSDYPETDELSSYELRVLDETHALHRHFRFTDFVNLTHGFAEWSDPGSSSSPIDPKDILRAEGVPEERIAEFETLADEHARLAAIFGQHS
jgi:hypothetical protein